MQHNNCVISRLIITDRHCKHCTININNRSLKIAVKSLERGRVRVDKQRETERFGPLGGAQWYRPLYFYIFLKVRIVFVLTIHTTSFLSQL